MRTRPEVFAEMAARGRELPSNERALKVENEEQNCLLAWNSSGTAMTATEIRERQREAYFRLKQQMDAKPNPAVDKFVDEVQRQVADAMGLADGDSRTLCLTDLGRVVRTVCEAGHRANAISVSLPERDFRSIMRDLGGRPDATKFRYNGADFLRGGKEVIIWWAVKMVESDREALEAEILRRLGRGGVAELPEGTGGDRVRSGPKPVSEVGIAPRPASGDNRDSNSLTHLSDEAKVIAAKEAIAAYARKKQLPSAAHLALFGELDGKRAGNKGAGAHPRIHAVDFAQPGADRNIVATRRSDGSVVVSGLPAGTMFSAEINGDVIHIRHSPDDRPNWTDAHMPHIIDDIDRNHHGLASEPLSRAIDQIWVRENGGAYADLISSRSERLAEMVNRGDSAADGERG